MVDHPLVCFWSRKLPRCIFLSDLHDGDNKKNLQHVQFESDIIAQGNYSVYGRRSSMIGVLMLNHARKSTILIRLKVPQPFKKQIFRSTENWKTYSTSFGNIVYNELVKHDGQEWTAFCYKDKESDQTCIVLFSSTKIFLLTEEGLECIFENNDK